MLEARLCAVCSRLCSSESKRLVYHSVLLHTCPRVQPSKACWDGKCYFFYKIDVDLGFRNGEEYFMNIKWKRVSSYNAVSTEARMRRDEFNVRERN